MSAGGCFTLREAAAEVSKALKQTGKGNGSITAQGLRKWVLQGHSPYDWEMTAHFGRVMRFPAGLERRAVETWCRGLAGCFTKQGDEARAFSAVLDELALCKVLHEYREARRPCGYLTFDGWARALLAFVRGGGV